MFNEHALSNASMAKGIIAKERSEILSIIINFQCSCRPAAPKLDDSKELREPGD